MNCFPCPTEFQQSPVVNDQLSMLYHDLRVDGYAMMDMNLEETISNSSEEDLSGSSNEVKSKKVSSQNSVLLNF